MKYLKVLTVVALLFLFAVQLQARTEPTDSMILQQWALRSVVYGPATPVYKYEVIHIPVIHITVLIRTEPPIPPFWLEDEERNKNK